MTNQSLKPMLNSTELIAHMLSKGITFEAISQNEATTILNKVNYYFKVTAYRSNFPKNTAGQYENLDFAYLIDLASIDMQLRDYLLNLSLDIEHGLKVMLLNLIANDPAEDGYQIVQDFKVDHQSAYDQTLTYLRKNRYSQDLYTKHRDHLAIWTFLEIATFGTLSMFVDFYLERTQTKSVRKVHTYLKYSKNIRNACAHSNPLLINLFSEKEFLRHPSSAVQLAAHQMAIPINRLSDLKINDLVSLFYLHQLLQSPKMSRHRYQEGLDLINRYHRHEDWYAHNLKLTTFFNLFGQLVEYLTVKA